MFLDSSVSVVISLSDSTNNADSLLTELTVFCSEICPAFTWD
ncbi:hypothetical Protein YC6258_03633 [Gynuella sunshinyii YC6258]|uniref:Uncharacterized protein n=1 Tax=Gynuella sunshinyii YC6258 TaxID=1445510 RepID=A0A0C5VZ17_9GAMM|nr:hypothetical Protein YC6258_03633 [Gynuella sunshinyii YC6258]